MSNENMDVGGPNAGRDKSIVTNVLLGVVVLLLAALVFAQCLVASETPGGDLLIDETTTTLAVLATSDDSTSTTEQPAETSTTITTTTTTSTTVAAPETSTTLSPNSAGSPILTHEAAEEAVSRWVSAVSVLDGDAAWDLVARDSQLAIGGRGGFDAALSELATEYGSWALVSDPDTIVYPVDDDGPDYAFVVLFLDGVGEPTLSALAVPTVLEDGTAKVSPFVDSDMIEILSPDESLAAPQFTGAVEILVPSAGDVTVYVNGLEVEASREEEPGGGTLLVGVPGNLLEVGSSHTLTVIYVEEGVIHAKVVVFVVGE